MQGKRIIQWIWDWLGQGSMGENYEVLPTVQPVCQIDAFSMPVSVGRFLTTQNLVAGTLVIPLPPPPTPFQSRLWTYLAYSRTSAVGDRTRFEMVMGTVSNTLFFDNSNFVAITVPSATQINIAGAITLLPNSVSQQGLGAQLATPENPLQFSAIAVAAAGTITVLGSFIDIPMNAPIPGYFIR